jgi:hypothetical protein
METKETKKNENQKSNSKVSNQKSGQISKQTSSSTQRPQSQSESQGQRQMPQSQSLHQKEIGPDLKPGTRLLVRIPIVVSDLGTFEKKFPNSQAEMCKVLKQTFNVQIDKMIRHIDHRNEYEIRLYTRKTGRN